MKLTTQQQASAVAQTAKHPVTHCPDEACVEKTFFVSAELDGRHETGFVGDFLTTGTQNLSEAQKALLLERYKANGLFDANADLVGDTAKLIGESWEDKALSGADDMYVAGDPLVGGKGNQYAAVHVDAGERYVTMFKDGGEHGRGIVANALSEPINPEGNTAFTQYGLVFTDDHGNESKLKIAGGTATVTDHTGKEVKIRPPHGEYVVGDPADPVARVYYAELEGKGEPRLVVDYYEKPTPEAVEELVAAGLDRHTAENKRSVTTASFGFRVPDDHPGGTSRLPMGRRNGKPLMETKDGVKTYYDVHWNESEKTKFEIACDKPPEEPKPPVAPNEHARIWGDPHINNPDDKSGDRWSYNFDEPGTFNVLQDKDVTLNSLLVQGPNKTTVIDETGLSIGNDRLFIDKLGTLKLNDQTLGDGTYELPSGGSITKDGDDIEVKTTGEYDFAFETNKTWRGFTYMNISVFTKDIGVESDDTLPIGLLGETFDVDTEAETSVDNAVDFYRRSGLFSTV